MKTIFCAIISIMVMSSNLSATACSGSLIFNNQADINNFVPCETVTGVVRINSASTGDITDLTPLSSIRHINGNLLIINTTNLTSLRGLENLTSINSLSIMNNTILSDISALGSLRINAQLSIENNGALSQCCFFKAQFPLLSSISIQNNNKSTVGCDNSAQVMDDPSCDPPEVHPVPTVGSWGLIILTQLMLVIGLVGIREKKANKKRATQISPGRSAHFKI